MSQTYEKNHSEMIVTKIETFQKKLELPKSIKEKSILLYKKLIEKNIARGRPIDDMISAIIYSACRESSVNCTLKDITNVTGLRKKSIARCYRVIIANLDLKIPPVDIESHVDKIVKKGKISKNVKKASLEIINFAKKGQSLQGKDPTGVAAASIYLASKNLGVNISQKEISKISNVTEVTIRNRCKGLCS